MTGENRPHLPIGYWLKKADELLTARINEAQDANGLSRTEWQILNLLHETSSASKSEIVEILSPFGDANALGAKVDSLVQRGLVEAEVSGTGTGTGKLRLSPQGREVHTVALEVQKRVRHQAVQGITEADYVTTVRVLQQIVANLSTPNI